MARFLPSKFGDEHLFFRHDWFEEDLKLMPDWKDWVDAEERLGGAESTIFQAVELVLFSMSCLN